MGEIRSVEEPKNDAYLKERARDTAEAEQYIRMCDEVIVKMEALIPQVRDCGARVNSAKSLGDLQTAWADLYKLFKIDEDGHIEWEDWGKGKRWSWTLVQSPTGA